MSRKGRLRHAGPTRCTALAMRQKSAANLQRAGSEVAFDHHGSLRFTTYSFPDRLTQEDDALTECGSVYACKDSSSRGRWAGIWLVARIIDAQMSSAIPQSRSRWVRFHSDCQSVSLSVSVCQSFKVPSFFLRARFFFDALAAGSAVALQISPPLTKAKVRAAFREQWAPSARGRGRRPRA